MKKIHANAVRLGTIGKYAYYPTMMLLHPDIGSRDLLAETLEACHREGYKVIPYFPVAHPLPADWVHRSGRIVRAVDDVSFSINRGDKLGIAGESGCGKSTLIYSLLRLVPAPGRIASGEIIYYGW